MSKYGVRNDVVGSLEKTKIRVERQSEASYIPRRETGAGRDHGFDKSDLKARNLMQGGDGTGPHTLVLEDIHKKETLTEGMGKVEGTEVSLGSQG